MTPCTVVVAHPERLIAESIGTSLARFPGLVPLATVTSAERAWLEGRHAHAAAIDDRLPGFREVAIRLRGVGVRVVCLGEAGGDDFGIRVPLSASVRTLAVALAPATTVNPGDKRLTRREREVLSLVSYGLAGKQVAHHLGISPKTVERHKTSIYAKLRVANQAAAVRAAMARSAEGGIQWTQRST